MFSFIGWIVRFQHNRYDAKKIPDNYRHPGILTITKRLISVLRYPV